MFITVQQFQRETGCSDAELRLVKNSPLSERRDDGRIRAAAARQVLAGIRTAREIETLERAYTR